MLGPACSETSLGDRSDETRSGDERHVQVIARSERCRYEKREAGGQRNAFPHSPPSLSFSPYRDGYIACHTPSSHSYVLVRAAYLHWASTVSNAVMSNRGKSRPIGVVGR
jgi:hypothetical protein